MDGVFVQMLAGKENGDNKLSFPEEKKYRRNVCG